MSARKIAGRCVVIPQQDIDTDQIIPARYLTGLDRRGLSDGLFAALRAEVDCPLNDPQRRDAEILVAGRNFGCGSSREHAVWALVEWGFRAVVAPSIGDIFKANALQNGLLAVEVPDAFWTALVPRLGARTAELCIDLERQCVEGPGGLQCAFEIDPFARRCLLEGVDELGYLLARLPRVAAFEGGAR